jgi:hypothetical protein
MQVFCKIIALNYTNSYNLSQNGGVNFGYSYNLKVKSQTKPICKEVTMKQNPPSPHILSIIST